MTEIRQQESMSLMELDQLDENHMVGSQQVEEQEAVENKQEEDINVDFIPPSVHKKALFHGSSFDHFSEVPKRIKDGEECVMGIDEAGRGPVLGPMVYGCFYLPLSIEESLLKETHAFTDSKQLTASRRAYLMKRLCTSDSDLYTSCGWATRSLSAQDISSGMLKPAMYNLNAQALDATVALIRGVIHTRQVNVKEVYVDTLGAPDVHRRRLEAVFPGMRFKVEKKADALFPVVGAASVVAKVTRDTALEACAEHLPGGREKHNWGSGYPSDGRCVAWMKTNMDPVFGWGPECRFSWGTAKEMLEGKGKSGIKVDWSIDEDEDNGMKLTSFFVAHGEESSNEISAWYGRRVGQNVF